jgi:hypothetical protein
MLLQSLALAWLAGSALSAVGTPPLTAIAAALLALQGWEPLRRRVALLPAVAAVTAVGVALAGVALAGGAWYQRHLPAASAADVSHFIGTGPARVRGVIEGDRDERERSLMLRLRVSSVEDGDGWHTAEGLLLLRLPLLASYDDGDAIEARGKVAPPPQAAGFDYRAYLALEGVYAEMDYSLHSPAEDGGWTPVAPRACQATGAACAGDRLCAARARGVAGRRNRARNTARD